MKNERHVPLGPVLAIVSSAIAFSGCSTVAPYQKGNLADYTMRSDRDELATVMTSHIQFSREATTGGEGVGGGGDAVVLFGLHGDRGLGRGVRHRGSSSGLRRPTREHWGGGCARLQRL